MKREFDLDVGTDALAQSESSAFPLDLFVAPDLVFWPQEPAQAQAPVATRGPNEDERKCLGALRDGFVQRLSHGRYADAAGREWSQLPRSWRMALLMMGGVGEDVDSLDTMAMRTWEEIPEHEQAEVRSMVRGAKKHLLHLTALAARI